MIDTKQKILDTAEDFVFTALPLLKLRPVSAREESAHTPIHPIVVDIGSTFEHLLRRQRLGSMRGIRSRRRIRFSRRNDRHRQHAVEQKNPPPRTDCSEWGSEFHGVRWS